MHFVILSIIILFYLFTIENKTQNLKKIILLSLVFFLMDCQINKQINDQKPKLV